MAHHRQHRRADAGEARCRAGRRVDVVVDAQPLQGVIGDVCAFRSSRQPSGRRSAPCSPARAAEEPRQGWQAGQGRHRLRTIYATRIIAGVDKAPISANRSVAPPLEDASVPLIADGGVASPAGHGPVRSPAPTVMVMWARPVRKRRARLF